MRLSLLIVLGILFWNTQSGVYERVSSFEIAAAWESSAMSELFVSFADNNSVLEQEILDARGFLSLRVRIDQLNESVSTGYENAPFVRELLINRYEHICGGVDHSLSWYDSEKSWFAIFCSSTNSLNSGKETRNSKIGKSNSVSGFFRKKIDLFCCVPGRKGVRPKSIVRVAVIINDLIPIISAFDLFCYIWKAHGIKPGDCCSDNFKQIISICVSCCRVFSDNLPLLQDHFINSFTVLTIPVCKPEDCLLGYPV